jgi:hypothetical protein
MAIYDFFWQTPTKRRLGSKPGALNQPTTATHPWRSTQESTPPASEPPLVKVLMRDGEWQVPPAERPLKRSSSA